ncbi:IS3 family transposase, partial [Serratia ureilytica]
YRADLSTGSGALHYIDYYNRLRERRKGLSPVEYRTQARKAA